MMGYRGARGMYETGSWTFVRHIENKENKCCSPNAANPSWENGCARGDSE